jgi:hypothetical protein
VKTVSQFDYPVSNESKNGPVAYFPLYFLEIPLFRQKVVATIQFSLNPLEIFLGGS